MKIFYAGPFASLKFESDFDGLIGWARIGFVGVW